MHSLYNLTVHIISFTMGILGMFSKKMKLFVYGRKGVLDFLAHNISASDKTIWFHCASLGEFEQGVPIMEEIRKLMPHHKIVVSFFSPSGYEIKKNTPKADVVVYLPLDTPANAKKFIDSVHPHMAFFVKYEFWPNYLFELQKKKIPSFLVSGVFRPDQLFFKSYGDFMRNALKAFEHFFLQDENSKNLLNEIGFNNTTVSGDTRFDRVWHQTEMDNTLGFAANFKGNSICIVCGSTWPEDEAVLLDYINTAPPHLKFIIAPHKIEEQKIADFRQKINNETVLYSEIDEANLHQAQVLILNCIGLLSKLFSYADIAYIGGAMGTTGLHNILEPATFGIPIVIGKNYQNFPEAKKLKSLGGLFSISDSHEATAILSKLTKDVSFRTETGKIAGNFVKNNIGATEIITDYVFKN